MVQRTVIFTEIIIALQTAQFGPHLTDRQYFLSLPKSQ